MLNTVVLDDLRVLAVSGAERAAFLQGQLTQDVKRASDRATLMAGWADPKGRLLFAGHLFGLRLEEDALALLVPAETAETLLRRLRLYVLRAKVELAVLDIPVAGIIAAPEEPVGGPSIRLCGAGNRHLVIGQAASTAIASFTAAPRSDWQLADIRAGLPAIVTATSGEFVPQMVNLDLVDGISFTKGCYTGQEIVARMKYLGRVKRRMLRFASAGLPPAPGTALHGARGTVGQVVASAPAGPGSEFLAVIVVDDLPGPFHLDEAGSEQAERMDLPYDVPV